MGRRDAEILGRTHGRDVSWNQLELAQQEPQVGKTGGSVSFWRRSRATEAEVAVAVNVARRERMGLTTNWEVRGAPRGSAAPPVPRGP